MKDNSKIYDEILSPLFSQILDICKENDIQMFYAVALKRLNVFNIEIADGFYTETELDERFISKCISDVENFNKTKDSEFSCT